MKKLGIIGGTSWNSTALYFQHINQAVADQLGGLHSARLTLESLDFADYAACHMAGDWDSANAIVVAAAERLQAAGVDGLLLASNTMHKAYGAVASATGLPIVDIRDAAADQLARDGQSRIALLGTRSTMTRSRFIPPLRNAVSAITRFTKSGLLRSMPIRRSRPCSTNSSRNSRN